MTFVLDRLQGRQRVQGLRPAAAHRRHGHRPGRPPDRAGAGLAVGRAQAARADPGRTPGPRTSRTTTTCAGGDAAAGRRCRGWSWSSTSSRRWSRELPDFVTGLVGIAQRGRSLGVHLILATQRPGRRGHAPTSGPTPTCGSRCGSPTPTESRRRHRRPRRRAHRQVHPRPLLRPAPARPRRSRVQSARIGGRRPGQRRRDRGGRVRVTPVPWHGLGRPLPQAEAPAAGRRHHGHRPVGAGRRDRAARRGSWASPEQPSPWLPPLPELASPLRRAAGDAGRTRRGDEVPPVPTASTDLPAAQAREPLTLDLAHGGHLVIAGARRAPAGPPCCAPSPARSPRDAVAGRRAHLRDRLRHGRAAAAGRAAALRRGRRPATRPTGWSGCSAKLRGEIGRRQQLLAAERVRRRWPSSAPRSRPGRAAALDAAAARLVGGVLRGVRAVRLRPADRGASCSCCARAPRWGCGRSSPPTGPR